MYGMQGKRFFWLDLCRQLWRDEFAPDLARRVPVLFPFWNGWMLLGAKSFLSILRLPLRLRSGRAAKAGMHSTSSAFRGTAQTPYKRLNFGSGASTALRAPTRGARLRLSQTPAKRLNFAKRVADGDRRCTKGRGLLQESGTNPKREMSVESHPKKARGRALGPTCTSLLEG